MRDIAFRDTLLASLLGGIKCPFRLICSASWSIVSIKKG